MKREATREFRKLFLENRDETGRLLVPMNDGTGQVYCVEFIEPRGGVRTNWGSYNPSTGNIENKKGAGKFTGGIQAEDSLLTPENGYPDSKVLPGGSYMWSVTQKHNKWRKDNGYDVN